MILKINNVDVMPFVAGGGIKWSRKDLSGGNATIMQDGTTFRDRITSKRKLDVSCKPLTAAQQKTVIGLISPEYVTVSYSDPETNSTVTGTYYTESFGAAYLVKRANGAEWWGGLSFSLTEK